MLSVQRQQLILDYITAHRSVQVSELGSVFNVSLATVRRDLSQLQAQGLIRRVHGGAVLIEQGEEPPVLQRSTRQVEYKQRIGEAAAGLVQDGDTIIITSGTTTEAMVPYLACKNGLTVITNAINVAHHLTRYSHIAVIVLGGWLRHSELSMLGHLTEHALQDLHADRVFHGIFGLHPEHGLTGTYVEEVQTDRHIIAAAPELIILADHSKFGQIGPVRLAPLEVVSVVVTDSEAPAADVAALQARGITVIRA